ncbi:hypothetical protein VPH35_023006 [Triticum aestivum]
MHAFIGMEGISPANFELAPYVSAFFPAKCITRARLPGPKARNQTNVGRIKISETPTPPESPPAPLPPSTLSTIPSPPTSPSLDLAGSCQSTHGSSLTIPQLRRRATRTAAGTTNPS